MDENVQPGDASQEGAASETAETPTEQPFTEAQDAKLQQMLAEATELARKAGVEEGRRELQSQRDRNLAAESRRAQDSENALQAYKRQLGELDPDKAKDLRLGELEAKDRQMTQRQQEEEQIRQGMQAVADFNTATTDMLKGLGIDPNDKRIEWGEPTESLGTKYQRISKKAIEILSADSEKKTNQEKQRTKDLVAQERKEQGLDSPDTTQGAAVAPVTMPTADEIRAAQGNPAEVAKVNKRIEDFYASAKQQTNLTEF